jgi:hypothetical protein
MIDKKQLEFWKKLATEDADKYFIQNLRKAIPILISEVKDLQAANKSLLKKLSH